LTKLGKPRPGRKRTPEQQRDDAFTAKIVDESVERMKAMRSAACELLDGRPVETVDIMVGDKRAIDMIAVGGKKLSELTSDELAAFEKSLMSPVKRVLNSVSAAKAQKREEGRKELAAMIASDSSPEGIEAAKKRWAEIKAATVKDRASQAGIKKALRRVRGEAKAISDAAIERAKR